MNFFIAEALGTMLLIIFGDGVVANVVLKKSKAENSGWIVITTGWALGVSVAVYVTGWASGAHLNPAITIGLLSYGQISSTMALWYIGGQMAGAFLGAVLVWLYFLPHWAVTDDSSKKLAVFCTSPAIRSFGPNFFCEFLGTFILVVGVLGITSTYNNLSNGLAPFLVGILVWAIGLSLGGPTGYAINPARDLSPRLAHAILPIAGKGKSDWKYAWIPVFAPILGGIAGTWFYNSILPILVEAQNIMKSGG
ncbi:MAG: aquaporin family protein [Candidatus Brocadiae bacterium]|nr:aquaporin family protein [Candidatus Brocadiia bacterium]